MKVSEAYVIKDRNYFQFWDGEKFGHFKDAKLYYNGDLRLPGIVELPGLQGDAISLESAIELYTRE